MGNCYEIAGKKVMENQKLLVCHGIVSGQGKLIGQRIGHAWNETRRMVFDFSNGKKIIMGKQEYYKIGEINEKEVKKYPAKKAMELMLKYKNYGPWEEK